MKKPLIIIGGPTACGKTSISVDLAKRLNGEIISADSMQVYKYMDIGTAKITKEEALGVKHYLIDEYLPDFEFNVMVFKNRAKECIDKIYSDNKIPIVVGGTGFYINALIYDNEFLETENDYEYRERLYADAKKYGVEYNYNKLLEIDPDYAKTTHKNNIKRVARALEYYHLTGEKFSDHNKAQKAKESPYDLYFFILNMDREILYSRINTRVDKMVSDGLVDEVRGLLNMGYSKSLVSMQGLGYKEVIPYINGEVSLDFAIDELKKNTRHFAKRQLTWFSRQTNGIWIDVYNKTTDEIIGEMLKHINLE